jgi:hypothetical protein
MAVVELWAVKSSPFVLTFIKPKAAIFAVLANTTPADTVLA